ncbi:MAG: hypothetical protein JO023_25620 [Chloroflexi bacterium]|nr:hypothetical protein [Chloroflexota bacterium]
MLVGDLVRSAGLIPPTALVADAGDDPQQYNWSGVPTVPASFWSGPDPAVGGWDALYHRVGAFDVGTARQDDQAMEAEVREAGSLGLTLAVDGYVGRDSAVFQAAADQDLGLVDTYLWGRIDAACGGDLDTHTCHLDDDQLASIEQSARHHLQITRQDDGVLAYWILDDYPGDVRPALELLHRVVTEENLVDREPRATVCGFGGELDDRRRPVATTRAAFNTALRNFSPTACDAVALYPYGNLKATGDASNIDWSMKALLPYMLGQLRERGWDPKHQPLIGIPQTFRPTGHQAPTSNAVATQAEAYCDAGASTILFFAWHNTLDDSLAELFNTSDLRQGAAEGISGCETRWARGGP